MQGNSRVQLQIHHENGHFIRCLEKALFAVWRHGTWNGIDPDEGGVERQHEEGEPAHQKGYQYNADGQCGLPLLPGVRPDP